MGEKAALDELESEWELNKSQTIKVQIRLIWGYFEVIVSVQMKSQAI